MAIKRKSFRIKIIFMLFFTILMVIHFSYCVHATVVTNKTNTKILVYKDEQLNEQKEEWEGEEESSLLIDYDFVYILKEDQFEIISIDPNNKFVQIKFRGEDGYIEPIYQLGQPVLTNESNQPVPILMENQNHSLAPVVGFVNKDEKFVFLEESEPNIKIQKLNSDGKWITGYIQKDSYQKKVRPLLPEVAPEVKVPSPLPELVSKVEAPSPLPELVSKVEAPSPLPEVVSEDKESSSAEEEPSLLLPHVPGCPFALPFPSSFYWVQNDSENNDIYGSARQIFKEEYSDFRTYTFEVSSGFSDCTFFILYDPNLSKGEYSLEAVKCFCKQNKTKLTSVKQYVRQHNIQALKEYYQTNTDAPEVCAFLNGLDGNGAFQTYFTEVNCMGLPQQKDMLKIHVASDIQNAEVIFRIVKRLRSCFHRHFKTFLKERICEKFDTLFQHKKPIFHNL